MDCTYKVIYYGGAGPRAVCSHSISNEMVHSDILTSFFPKILSILEGQVEELSLVYNKIIIIINYHILMFQINQKCMPICTICKKSSKLLCINTTNQYIVYCFLCRNASMIFNIFKTANFFVLFLKINSLLIILEYYIVAWNITAQSCQF